MIPLMPYYLPQIKSRYGKVFYQKNVFTDDLIQRVTDLVNSDYIFQKGKTGHTEDNSITDSYRTNNRDIAYIIPNLKSKWLYDLLFPLALEANKDFEFDIDTVTDPIHYVIYPSDGGHLDWHMDIGGYGVNRRKIALTVELSDPKDYEGGNFEIWLGGDKPIRFPREKGDVMAFPSFLLHRVVPITKGERRCLVFWVGGRPFR